MNMDDDFAVINVEAHPTILRAVLIEFWPASAVGTASTFARTFGSCESIRVLDPPDSEKLDTATILVIYNHEVSKTEIIQKHTRDTDTNTTLPDMTEDDICELYDSTFDDTTSSPSPTPSPWTNLKILNLEIDKDLIVRVTYTGSEADVEAAFRQAGHCRIKFYKTDYQLIKIIRINYDDKYDAHKAIVFQPNPIQFPRVNIPQNETTQIFPNRNDTKTQPPQKPETQTSTSKPSSTICILQTQDTTHTQLRQHFSQFGTVLHVHSTNTKHTNTQTNTTHYVAFVEFESIQEATIAKDNCDPSYQARWSNRAQTRQASRTHDHITENNTLCVIMPTNYTHTTLPNNFNKYGQIARTNVIQNADGSRLGFITFENKEAALRAKHQAPEQFGIRWRKIPSTKTHVQHYGCGELIARHMWNDHLHMCPAGDLVTSTPLNQSKESLDTTSSATVASSVAFDGDDEDEEDDNARALPQKERPPSSGDSSPSVITKKSHEQVSYPSTSQATTHVTDDGNVHKLPEFDPHRPPSSFGPLRRPHRKVKLEATTEEQLAALDKAFANLSDISF